MSDAVDWEAKAVEYAAKLKDLVVVIKEEREANRKAFDHLEEEKRDAEQAALVAESRLLKLVDAVKQEQKDRASQSDDATSRQLAAALKSHADSEAKCANLAEKVEGLLSVIRQEREERAGEVALNRKRQNELQSRNGELETRLQVYEQSAEKKNSAVESVASLKLRLSVAEKESARLRGELNTAIDNSREQSKLAAESLNALETKRFELERDLSDVTEDRNALSERLEEALKAPPKAADAANGGPCEHCAENVERLEEEQDRLERTQQAAGKALEAARRAAASLSEVEQAKSQVDAELATAKFELEKSTLTTEGLRIKVADLTKKIGAPPPDVAQLQKRIDELEAKLSERPQVGFADADLSMVSPQGTPKLSRRGRIAALAEAESGYDSAEENEKAADAPTSPLAQSSATTNTMTVSTVSVVSNGAGESSELRSKLDEAEAERVRLLDANKKLRDERDSLQEQLRVAQENATGGDAPITGGPPPPPMAGGAAAGGGPPPPPPPMPAFKKGPTKLVIKKSDKSAALLNSSDGSASPKAGGAGQTTAAIVDAIKSGVKLRKTERPPRKEAASEPKNAGLVDLSNLGSLASTIARERRQRALVSSQRMQRASAEQDAISQPEPAAAPFPKLRPVGLPKGDQARAAPSPAVSPSVSRLQPLRPTKGPGAVDRPGADRPGANRPGGDGEGLRSSMRRAATMTPEMRKAVTQSMNDSSPSTSARRESVPDKGQQPTVTVAPATARPGSSVTQRVTTSTSNRASYATTRPTPARDAVPAKVPVDTSSRASFAGVQRARPRGSTASGAQPSLVKPLAVAQPVAQPALSTSSSRLAQEQASAVEMDDDDDESTEEIPTTPLPIAPSPSVSSLPPTPINGSSASAVPSSADDDDDDAPPLPSTPAPSAAAPVAASSGPALADTKNDSLSSSKKKKKKKSSHRAPATTLPPLPDDPPPAGITRNNSSYRNHSELDSMIAGLEDQ